MQHYNVGVLNYILVGLCENKVVLQYPISFYCQRRGAVHGTDTVLRMLQVFFLQAGCFRFCRSVYLRALFSCSSSWTYRGKNIIGTLLHLYLFLDKIQSEDKININYMTSYSTITALLSCTVICNLDFLFLQTSVFLFCVGFVFCFVFFYYFCIIIWCQ